MTREETKEVLMTIRAVYPNFNVKPEEMTPTINAWQIMLEEYPKEMVMAALKVYIKTNSSGFAPSVSQLISSMYETTKHDQMTEGEAWALVKRAIQDGNYHAEERFNELPATLQRAVGNAGMIRQWAQTDTDEVNTVIMSNFQRSYKAILEKQEFSNKISDPLYELTKGLAEKLSGQKQIGVSDEKRSDEH